MLHTTVRITSVTHKTLKELSKDAGQPMSEIIEKALETYRREKFWKACDEAYARLRNDPKAWAEELEERKIWEVTLADGLDPY